MTIDNKQDLLNFYKFVSKCSVCKTNFGHDDGFPKWGNKKYCPICIQEINGKHSRLKSRKEKTKDLNRWVG